MKKRLLFEIHSANANHFENELNNQSIYQSESLHFLDDDAGSTDFLLDELFSCWESFLNYVDKRGCSAELWGTE